MGLVQDVRNVIHLGLPGAVAVGASFAIASFYFNPTEFDGFLDAIGYSIGYAALPGLLADLMVGTLTLVDRSSARDTRRRLKPAVRAGLAGLLVFAVVSAAGVALIAIDDISASEYVPILIVGAVLGVFVALLGMISFYVATPTNDLDRTEPRVALRRDRRAALGIIGLLVGIGLWTESIEFTLLTTLLCILLLASGSRWPAYVGARTLLWVDRALPWRVMDFLGDAHDRGVLRRVGSAYQFRHVRIKESLAGRASQSRRLDLAGGEDSARLSREAPRLGRG